LTRLARSEALPALMRSLSEGDPRTRGGAVVALLAIAERDPTPALRGVLPLLRRTAIFTWATEDDWRNCAALRRQIEAVTGASKALPLPSTRASVGGELPIPTDRQSQARFQEREPTGGEPWTRSSN
jgi:hypothetical protein